MKSIYCYQLYLQYKFGSCCHYTLHIELELLGKVRARHSLTDWWSLWIDLVNTSCASTTLFKRNHNCRDWLRYVGLATSVAKTTQWLSRVHKIKTIYWNFLWLSKCIASIHNILVSYIHENLTWNTL